MPAQSEVNKEHNMVKVWNINTIEVVHFSGTHTKESGENIGLLRDGLIESRTWYMENDLSSLSKTRNMLKGINNA